MEYLDFEVAIEADVGGEFRVAVLRSPVGETREATRFPFSPEELRTRLGNLREALIRARGERDVVPAPYDKTDSGGATARDFGRVLFEVLFAGQVGSLYVESIREARKKPDRGLRVKLRTQTPELADLPWEFLLDPRKGDFVCLSNATPLVRYLESPNPPEALAVTPPLRILGMIASPAGLPALDVEREKALIDEAVSDSRKRGLLDITWLPAQTWQALTQALGAGGGGPWHIFHFIGHGGFDPGTNEGHLALATEDGSRYELSAIGLSRLLGDHESLRLVVLNACEGARGGTNDVFVSTAAVLVRRGLPAVVSMQQAISDSAAIQFARELYRTVALGSPVDGAVAEGRKAVSLALPRSLEWATPVLHMRSPDGILFKVREADPWATEVPLHETPEAPRREARVPVGHGSVGVAVRWPAVVVALAVGAGAWWFLEQRHSPLSVPASIPTFERHADTVSFGTITQLRVPTFDGQTVAWSSSDSAVAKVDSHGRVTGVGHGSATITARGPAGETAQTAIVVRAIPVASVEVKPQKLTLCLGRDSQLVAAAKDSNGEPLHDRHVSWRSNDTMKAVVDEHGRVTAGHSRMGFVAIKATSDNIVGSMILTVTDECEH